MGNFFRINNYEAIIDYRYCTRDILAKCKPLKLRKGEKLQNKVLLSTWGNFIRKGV